MKVKAGLPINENEEILAKKEHIKLNTENANKAKNTVENKKTNSKNNRLIGKHTSTIKKESVQEQIKEIKELEDKQKEEFIKAINSLRK